eukprot:CAMPEP_0203823840 /NCGR_PEP_ID=MMETSP0115-20131106/50227_1 /ASSEMBLY_ACC=CAM_ASM_000227 /TAXON_ID=33651 /ORGANISM="Bicosoecid sp, Strain ms1" /LENGTH=185 /DNA_ID=CAMNT_0050732873 /DNA_START=49 /DNA_END=606 /DNA_ORIENTATION=-
MAVAGRVAARWVRAAPAVRAPVLARRSIATTRAALAEEAEEAHANVDGDMLLTFAVPDKALVQKRAIFRVTVPGRAGTFGIQKRSPPMLAELRPGVVDVDFDGKGDSVQYFVPGGFAFTHADNTVDVSAPEAVLLEDIDADLVRSEAEKAKQAKDAAASGSPEEAKAAIASEVYKALGHALGVSV